MKECQASGRVVPQGRKTIYVAGGWPVRCSCGAVVSASVVGWDKSRKRHGLLFPVHLRGDK